MANSFSTLFPSFFVVTFIITTFFLFSTTAETHRFVRTISPTTLGLDSQEKLTHLHFFFHDVVRGRNQTAVRVAAAPATDKSPTQFGAVVMMDDPLTESAEPGSKVVGRAQGMYASASQTELGFLMVMNLAFTEGKFNGSSLTVLGRNTVISAVREMPVVGGSGIFRFARGYAQAKTRSIDVSEAIVEYNVYVFHY
ncbi:dirigent protein 22-like [Abrus precatorius]|uniref:Dirigent protein n=1 Tax=Abrus precatorius TaxID=3816 RepID=A0A8B8M932_ABRPR|nr:dirigent protein 22-like [Abrus precatorius]